MQTTRLGYCETYLVINGVIQPLGKQMVFLQDGGGYLGRYFGTFRLAIKNNEHKITGRKADVSTATHN